VTIQDPIAALIAFLEADAPIVALVGTRIYGAESRVTEADNQPRYMLVVRTTGGIAQGYVDMMVPRVDFECYGATPLQAFTLYLALHEALKNLSRDVHNSTLLHLANQTAGPAQTRDEDTHWPLVWSSWNVWVGEASAT